MKTPVLNGKAFSEALIARLRKDWLPSYVASKAAADTQAQEAAALQALHPDITKRAAPKPPPANKPPDRGPAKAPAKGP